MEKLKTMRTNQKLTCQDMATKLKISKAYYWQIENNYRKLSYDMAVRIANIFKTTPDNIFYEEHRNITK